MFEVAGKGIRMKWEMNGHCMHPWILWMLAGERWAMTEPGLVGVVGYVKGQPLVWTSRLEQEEFFKKKM